MTDRLYLALIRRVGAAPGEYLGCKSLTLLHAFHAGYSLFRPDLPSEDIHILYALRESVATRYAFEPSSVPVFEMLRRLAEDEEKPFDLFFSEVDVCLAQKPEAARRRSARFVYRAPPPVSVVLNLFEKPLMFLPRISVRCARAVLDGFERAALDTGHPRPIDLSGFAQRVRDHFSIRGGLRWEKAILDQFSGDETAAFEWAARELNTYRAQQGLPAHFQPDLLDRGEIGADDF
jgi:hypothetical protein